MSGSDSIEASIVRMGLAAPGEALTLAALTGGVSSDIYRVDLANGAVCVKRALARLKVAAQWNAPVERNRFEVAWLRFANQACPGAAPQVIAEDPLALAFAMPYLAPDAHPTWKSLLRDGQADARVAARVGTTLGTIHAASADRTDLARSFATDASFHAIRLEPYLVASARVHEDLAPALLRLVEVTAATRRVLVHGDVSPKNILVGPNGPILIDAECAWFGDPAFDLAFCLNHLLLKSVWRPAHLAAFQQCFAALAEAYLECVRWEPAREVQARAAALLPALMLARIDGKSPVEYLSDPRNRALVREFARARIAENATPIATLSATPSAAADDAARRSADTALATLAARWHEHLRQHPPYDER